MRMQCTGEQFSSWLAVQGPAEMPYLAACGCVIFWFLPTWAALTYQLVLHDTGCGYWS
jgi:hypothetical protein